jgi:O-antigen ligase
MSAAHRIGPGASLHLRRRMAQGKRERELVVGVAAGCVSGLVAGAVGVRNPFFVALAMATVALPLAATLVGGLRRLLLAIVALDIPLQIDMNPGYRDDIGRLSALSGWTLSATTCALVALYLGWTAQLLVGPRDAASRPRIEAAALPLAFLAIMTLSLAVARDRTLAGFEINLLVQLTLLFVYVASTVRTRSDVAFLAGILLAGMCLASVLAVAMYLTGADLRLGTHAAAVAGPRRLTGAFGSPNEAGSYFAFYVPLAIAVVMASAGRARALALTACVLGSVALALTLSRGAWLALVVAIVTLVAGSRASGRQLLSRRALVGAAVTMLIVLLPLSGEISTRLTGGDAGAAEGRVPLIEIALRMIAHHPVLGLGANNFVVALPDYAGPEFSGDWLNVVHNKYLLVWTEAGIAALVIFVLFLLTTIRAGWRARRQPDPLLSATALGLTAAVAGMAVHMNFDIFLSRISNQSLWLAAALLASPALRPVTGDARRGLTLPPSRVARRAVMRASSGTET